MKEQLGGHSTSGSSPDTVRLWDQVTYSLADIASFDDQLNFQEAMETVRDMDIDQAMAYVCRRALSIPVRNKSTSGLRLIKNPAVNNDRGDME